MVKKIELQELLDYIEKRIEVNKMTVIHVYDYGKRPRIFDIRIEPYENSQIEYFEMDMDEENPYDKLFDALKEIYPSQTKLVTGCGLVYGYSVQLIICKNVQIIVDFYYKEGQNWMKKVYEENK